MVFFHSACTICSPVKADSYYFQHCDWQTDKRTNNLYVRFCLFKTSPQLRGRQCSPLLKLSKATMEIILYFFFILSIDCAPMVIMYILTSLKKNIIVFYICFLHVIKICFNIWIVDICQNINNNFIKTLQIVRYDIVSIQTNYSYWYHFQN